MIFQCLTSRFIDNLLKSLIQIHKSIYINICNIKRKKTTRIFSLQDMFRILLYPSSVVILNC